MISYYHMMWYYCLTSATFDFTSQTTASTEFFREQKRVTWFLTARPQLALQASESEKRQTLALLKSGGTNNCEKTKNIQYFFPKLTWLKNRVDIFWTWRRQQKEKMKNHHFAWPERIGYWTTTTSGWFTFYCFSGANLSQFWVGMQKGCFFISPGFLIESSTIGLVGRICLQNLICRKTI